MAVAISKLNHVNFYTFFNYNKELFSSGMTVGKDFSGSHANTLFFAFIGSYLALLIWFKDLSYSFRDIVNSNIFTAETLMIYCAGIGIALKIPIASWINAC